MLLLAQIKNKWRLNEFKISSIAYTNDNYIYELEGKCFRVCIFYSSTKLAKVVLLNHQNKIHDDSAPTAFDKLVYEDACFIQTNNN